MSAPSSDHVDANAQASIAIRRVGDELLFVLSSAGPEDAHTGASSYPPIQPGKLDRVIIARIPHHAFALDPRALTEADAPSAALVGYPLLYGGLVGVLGSWLQRVIEASGGRVHMSRTYVGGVS